MSNYYIEHFVCTKQPVDTIGTGGEYEWQLYCPQKFDTFKAAITFERNCPIPPEGNNRRISKRGEDGEFIQAWPC